MSLNLFPPLLLLKTHSFCSFEVSRTHEYDPHLRGTTFLDVNHSVWFSLVYGSSKQRGSVMIMHLYERQTVEIILSIHSSERGKATNRFYSSHQSEHLRSIYLINSSHTFACSGFTVCFKKTQQWRHCSWRCSQAELQLPFQALTVECKVKRWGLA